jgi:hypothetical protein
MTVGEFKDLLNLYKVPDDAEIYVGLDCDDVLDPLQRFRYYEGQGGAINELQISNR